MLNNNNLKSGSGGGRLEYIDVVKGVAMFLVVYGHDLVSLNGGNNHSTGIMFNFIYSFHMPLFMIMSGYFFNSSLKYTFSELVKSKFNQLIVPIIVWAFISSVPLMFSGRSILEYGEHALRLIFVSDSEFLWYLKTLFFNYIISYAVLKIVKNYYVAFPIVVVMSQVVFPYYGVHYYALIFWIGIFMNYKSDIINKYSKQILIGSILISSTIYASRVIDYFNGSFFRIDLIPSSLVSIFQKASVLTLKLSMSFAIIMVVKRIYKANVFFSYLSSLGKNTLGIYIVHTIFRLVYGHFINLHIADWTYTFLIVPIFSLLNVYIVNYIVNRISRYEVVRKYFI